MLSLKPECSWAFIHSFIFATGFLNWSLINEAWARMLLPTLPLPPWQLQTEPYQPLQEWWCGGISSWSFPGSLSVQWKTWQVNTLHFHPNQWSGVRGFILVLALSLFNWWTCIMFWPTENKICDYSQCVWLAHIIPGWKIWPITSCLTEKNPSKITNPESNTNICSNKNSFCNHD